MSDAQMAPPKRSRLGWPSDANLIRGIFFALLAGAGTLLYLDFMSLNEQTAAQPLQFERPILPAVERPEFDPNAPRYDPSEQVTVQAEVLSAPMVATLAQNGVMLLSGYIDPNAAPRIIEELDRTKEYIKTVQINSPGGSVNDALEISAHIRKLGFSTTIEDGGYCASSCPILFAGGTARLAGKTATIGLHQIYGATPQTTAPQAMSDAQTTTARITQHLDEMGVDPKIWIHALQTPPNKLYYLTNQEMKQFKLATKIR
ncbi:ATP-dependent Clp protease proteolytic subunit [Maritalea porphyrae]|jgi:hypothetical protein|uniref:ATP-dependent Clp protease proteolytic subunit n=1 Tax=Maritalea porphyrae TaxID=880732 RepID=UPI0022B0024A|nr:ATP-dependent Clp protease proteolytic subunit [Maritalea porphyrae]MCZ4272419.1 ATP-dependent Clp protease proteolytic subunit [Maritalea porphyrae]